jgi:hypothetical protein
MIEVARGLQMAGGADGSVDATAGDVRDEPARDLRRPDAGGEGQPPPAGDGVSGSWNNEARRSRAARRAWDVPTWLNDGLGFRLARSLP